MIRMPSLVKQLQPAHRWSEVDARTGEILGQF